MEQYEIIKLGQSLYNCIVVAKSYKSPFDNIRSLESDLVQFGRGYVLFDLFYINGMSSNRFICAKFNGKEIDMNSFKTIDHIDETLNDICSVIIAKDSYDVSRATIPRSQKYLAKKKRI